MTLSEMQLPMAFEDCKDLALVYEYPVAVALYDLQLEHGDPRHVCLGSQLTDGRWMIHGEILSMVGKDGIFWWLPQYMTPELMAAIEVVPLAELAALLPA